MRSSGQQDSTSVEVVANLLATVELDRHYYQQILSELPAAVAVALPDLSIAFANNEFRRLFAADLRDGAVRSLPECRSLEGLARIVRGVIATGASKDHCPFGAAGLAVSARRLQGRGTSPAMEALLVFEETGPRDPAPEPDHAALLSSIDAIVWELDVRDWRYLYVSPQAENLLGYPLAQWLESPALLAHIHTQDKEWVESAYRAAASGKGSSGCEYRAVTADGRPLWLLDYLRPAAADSARLRGLTVDITPRKQKETRLREGVNLDVLAELARRAGGQLQREVDILGRRGDVALQHLAPTHPLREHLIEMLGATGRLATLRDEFLKLARQLESEAR